MRSLPALTPTALLGLLLTAPAAAQEAASVIRVAPGDEVQETLQEALLDVAEGGTIQLAPGTYRLERGLSLDGRDVTIRGAGKFATVLSFAGQSAGGEGLLVTGANISIEDLAIEDTAGDGIKLQGVEGVFLRRLRVEWTRGPDTQNGAYGLYPVECRNVLIEDCVAIAAADAGIYVGQSEHIVVRRNRAERNVAGIEVENSRHADVYGNLATGNTGGILVFDLPGLPKKNGGDVRVFDNEVHGNNHPNFAPAGAIVSIIPPGTGMMVMALDHVWVFGNRVREHDCLSLAVVSYTIASLADHERKTQEQDPEYEPWAEAVYVYDNHFGGGGGRAPSGPIGGALALYLADRPAIPAIVYDGVTNPAHHDPQGVEPGWGVYLRDNSGGDYVNLNMLDPASGPSFEPAPIAGAVPARAPVSFPGLD